jgi:hypothetical protein
MGGGCWCCLCALLFVLSCPVLPCLDCLAHYLAMLCHTSHWLSGALSCLAWFRLRFFLFALSCLCLSYLLLPLSVFFLFVSCLPLPYALPRLFHVLTWLVLSWLVLPWVASFALGLAWRHFPVLPCRVRPILSLAIPLSFATYSSTVSTVLR